MPKIGATEYLEELMDAGRIKQNLKTSGISTGQPKVSQAKTNVVKKQPEKRAAVSTTPAVSSRKTSGITTSIGADGSEVKVADSGMELKRSPDNATELKLPTGEVIRSSENSKSGFQVESDGKVSDTTSFQGFETFKDKKTGNTVFVDQESMVVEVLNKADNVNQTFLPDGSQVVTAYNLDKSGNETSSAVKFDPQGNQMPGDTFKNLEIKADGRISYEFNGHKTERTPGLALPGHPDPNQKSQSKSAANSLDMGPMVVLQEQPATQLIAKETADKSAPATSKKDSVFGGYPDISQDFRVGEKPGFVTVFETESGLMARQENPKGLDSEAGQKESVWSYKLPNGHTFRTDGKAVETVGKDQGIKNARMVNDNGSPILAYSDKDGNRHRLNTVDASYEVQNKQGSLIQTTSPDGSQKFTVQGTYTTDSSKTVQYSNTASFDAKGSMISNDGIGDLAITDKGMAFTLPNGEPTSRSLVAPTSVRAEPLKLDEGWGDGASLADRILMPKTETASGSSVVESAASDSKLPANFSDRYGKEGWTVKSEANYNDFNPRDMDGKEVAFRRPDPQTGEVLEHRGVLRSRHDQSGSALFGLEGQKGEFNNNFIKEIAVNDTFATKFSKEGWTVKSDANTNDFAAQDLDGKEDAFRRPDPETGQMVNHRGILNANKEQSNSALFGLEGQKGEFNNNFIREIAVNDSKGVSSEENRSQVRSGSTNTASPAEQAQAAKPTGQVKTPPPAHSKWGISRVFLPGGGQITQLPSGITVTDGKELFAKDKQGNRLAVKKEAYQTPDGKIEHFLSFKNTEGVQYTMSDAHLDLIVTSKDDKVQQLVQEKGPIINSVYDPITEGPHAGRAHNFLAEFPVTIKTVGAPRLEGFDPRHPDRMIAQGSPNGFYELPFPLPSPPGMQQRQTGKTGQNPSKVSEKRTNNSVRPGMWEKVKIFITGKPGKTDEAKVAENEGRGDDVDSEAVAQESPANGAASSSPRSSETNGQQASAPDYSGYHGGHHYPGAQMQVDPYAREMKSMQTGMAISNVVSTAAVVAGFVFPGAFFFSPFGWY